MDRARMCALQRVVRGRARSMSLVLWWATPTLWPQLCSKIPGLGFSKFLDPPSWIVGCDEGICEWRCRFSVGVISGLIYAMGFVSCHHFHTVSEFTVIECCKCNADTVHFLSSTLCALRLFSSWRWWYSISRLWSPWVDRVLHSDHHGPSVTEMERFVRQ